MGVTGSSDAQQPARTLLLVGADMPVSEPTMGSSRFNVFFLFILVISPLLFLLGARGLNVVLRFEIVHGVVKDGFCKEFAKDIESNMCDKTSAE